MVDAFLSLYKLRCTTELRATRTTRADRAARTSEHTFECAVESDPQFLLNRFLPTSP